MLYDNSDFFPALRLLRVRLLAFVSSILFADVYFCWASVLGPALGPIAGGFLGAAAGWRWVEALLGIFAAILTILGILFIPETVSLLPDA